MSEKPDRLCWYREVNKMQNHGFKPTRILVPTDFSESAQRAVSTAAALAKEFKAAIYLLNVIPMFPISGESGYSAIFPEERYLEYSKRYASEKLLASVETLQSEKLDAAFGMQVGNDVVGNIMMVLERESTDLLIISTHGVSGWRPMIFGSIAEKVIRLVECPLLLLHTPKSTT